MVALNEHQSRLWLRMLQSIEDFQLGKLKFYEFVGTLEGALDAGEFLDRNLVEKWYDCWTPLESVRAQKGNDVSVEEVSQYVSDMKKFLESVPIEGRFD